MPDCVIPYSLVLRLGTLNVKIHQRGGAVETGCSGSHYITGCFVIYYYPHPLHPPPTAPPFDEYPPTVYTLITYDTCAYMSY